MEINRTIISALVVCGVVALGACKRTESRPDTTTGAMTGTSANPSATVGATPGSATPGAGETTTAKPTTMTDAEIFAVLDEINENEVELGKIARDKATNAEVKAFAREMVTAHEKMEREGEALAQKLAVSPKPEASDSLEAASDMTEDRLEALAKGMTFDTAYVNAQVTGHEQTLAFINQAKGQATSAELKTLLEGATLVVQSHLDRAKTLQATLGKK